MREAFGDLVNTGQFVKQQRICARLLVSDAAEARPAYVLLRYFLSRFPPCTSRFLLRVSTALAIGCLISANRGESGARRERGGGLTSSVHAQVRLSCASGVSVSVWTRSSSPSQPRPRRRSGGATFSRHSKKNS